MKKVIVIGAGIGGLGAACYLGKAGYEVTVLEKNERPGGRANIFSENGFTFDMGPSWYLMPDIFEHFYNMLGEKVEDHLDLVKLSPSYRIFFKDEAKVIDMQSNLQKDAVTFEGLEPGAGEKFKEYIAKSGYQYAIAKHEFMYKNYDSIFDFLNWRVMTEGAKLNILSKMDSYVSKYFKNNLVKKIIEYQLVFLGSSPYDTPALYNIMNYIDTEMGVFYPQGGTYKVIESLVAIANKHGVTIKTNAPVAKIRVEDGVAVGVELETGEMLAADIVISNADMEFTESVLLDDNNRTYDKAYWNKKTMAPSAFIMYLGLKDKVPSLLHHSLLFSKDWKKNFAEIFDVPVFPTDPSFYVCAPSKTDPSVAPAGKENLFVLVPIAAGLDYTEAELHSYRDKILETMEKEMNIPNLKDRIEYEKLFCVKDFKAMYNAYKGSALGLAHTFRQTAFFRPNNYSKKIKGLYFVGAGTNPGIGMPICLISAELAYKRIVGDKSPSPITEVKKMF